MSQTRYSDESSDANSDNSKVLRLEKQIKELREASFEAIRDLEANQEMEKALLKKRYEDALKNFSSKYEQKLKEEASKIEIDARKNSNKSIESSLNAARKEWAESEDLRFKKFQVDLVHAKTVELEEREAYWRAEIARVSGSSNVTQNNQRSGKNKKRKNESERNRDRRMLFICGTLLVISAAAFLYALAPQGNANVKPFIEEIISSQDENVKNTLYAYVPWLKGTPKNSEILKETNVTPKETNKVTTAFVVTSSNMREDPNLNAKIIRVLRRGTPVQIIGVRDDWSRIALNDLPGETGWVSNRLLKTVE